MENDSAKEAWPVLFQKKIPRPLNAFMLYANEHRKTFSYLFPVDSNKQISRRLGQGWKSLNPQEKMKYFEKANEIDQEHKRKYPDYVYNPRYARMKKAIRTNLRDRSVRRASSMLSRPSGRLDQSLPMGQGNGPMGNGLYDLPGTKSAGVKPLYYDSCALPVNLLEISEEEKTIFEKEKATLEAAESYAKVGQHVEFIQDPKLFANNADYHKEYITKYFNQIPDYETYNVTTEDGISFPYVVTIPNLIVRQNGQGASYN